METSLEFDSLLQEFQHTPKHSKKFAEILKDLQIHLKTPDIEKLLTLEKLISLIFFFPKVEFFLFSHFLLAYKHIISTKNSDICQIFMNLTLKFGAKHISLKEIEDKIKPEKAMSLFLKAFNLIPLELVIEELLRQKIDNKNAYLIILMLENRKCTEGVPKIEEYVQSKLKEEYFIDMNQRKPNAFRFMRPMRLVINKKNFSEFYLPNMIKLMKRSENNLDIMKTILSDDLLIDLSEFAEEILLNNLKEYFFGKNSETCIFIGKKITFQINDFEVLLKLMRKLDNLVNATNNEQNKMVILQIFEGFINKLGKLESEQIKILQKELLTSFLNNFAIISLEDLIPSMQKLIDLFIANSQELVLETKEIALLKANVLNQKNKFALISTLSFLNQYLKKYTESNSDWSFSELISIIDAINAQILVINFKTPQKLVSNYQSFLIALEIVFLGYGRELTKNVKYESICNNFFNETILMHQSKFLQKASIPELNGISNIIVKAMVYILEGGEKFLENKLLISNTLIECLLEKGMIISSMKTILKKMPEKIKPKTHNLLINGLFYQVFFTEITETKELEKIRWILKYLIKNLNLVFFEENELFQIIFLIYHDEISTEELLTDFLQKTFKEKEIFEKFQNFFKEKSQDIITVLFSNSGVFSKKKSNFNAFLSYFKAFIDFKYEEFISFYFVFLEESNFYEGEALDKFEENMILARENNPFLQNIESIGQFLLKSGFLEKNVHILYEEFGSIKEKPVFAKKPANPNVNKKGGKKQGNKPEKGKKIELLDEEEIAKLRLDQLYQKMWSYYEKLALIFKVFVGRIEKNPIGLALFYQNIYPGLIGLAASRTDFRGGLLDILHVFFGGNKKLKRFKLVLAEMLLKKLDYESPRETYQEDLMKLLAYLPSYINEIEHKESLDFWEDFMRFIIRNKEFDLKAKNLTLNFLFSLTKMQSLQAKIPVIYEEIINNINALSSFEELLLNFLNFLLPKLPQKALKIMFENILDISENAKETCLKSVFVTYPLVPEHFFEISFEIVMKIRIMQLSESPEISTLCLSLLSLIKYKDNPEEIESFEAVEFLRNNTKESLDDFCQIATELLKEKPEISSALFHAILSGTKGLLALEKADDDKFLFFPHFLKMNLAKIDECFFEPIFSIIIENLCRESNKILTEKALEIGKELIKFYGAKSYEKLLTFLNLYLDKKTLDMGQQVCTVVFIGVLSPFISNTMKVKEITDKILELLESSSENQQINLSRCLSDMIIFFPDAEKVIQDHLTTLFTEKNKKKQRFSAYLISGLIKGLGISTIESLQIFEKIEAHMEGIFKKDVLLKEGILNLLESLLENNGKLVEPYLARFLNILMQFFGDNNDNVRTQSLDICRSAISKLSSFGVKNVLPLLLKGIDEKSMNWRAKLANISALGNLAYCSPKQLSLSLPQIIPKLTATLSDTHPKIREGADEALKVIGKTIKNPEISQNVDILIKAINNPFDENKKGLEVLLKTQFVHYIDIPALSLIIPIIDYGLRSRESILKENASQIVGTISHLIKDPKDLLPYLDILVYALKISVCDPIGEVRNITAKAFGALAKKLGEANSSKIIKTLKGILESPDSKNNEKAGAAQAYSEVICAIGVDYFERNRDYILSKTLDTRQYLKESYIGLFIYLPGIIEEAFEPYLSVVLDNLVESLSDENENIRGLTLRVVKILIDRFGLKNTQLLLAPINDGLFNTNMRKRNSSINLTGDLLKVLYKSRNSQGEGGFFNVIYEETLASVYILKHDEYEIIKNTADNVWKENVSNTPKILKQILPTLVKKMIELMTYESGIEKLAQNTIKEYCGKYSDSVFYDFLEILDKRCKSEDPNFRGIFLTLNQFIKETQTSTIHKNSKGILNLLRTQMVSQEDLIRKSVYLTYNSYLEKFIDAKPLNETLEPFLEKMETLDESNTVYEDYLKVFDEFIALKNQKILNYMLGVLFERPLKGYRIEIITNNARILGSELYKNNTVEDIIPRMLEEIFNSLENKSRLSSLLYCICQLSINIDEENTMKFISDCLDQIKKYKDKHPDKLLIILDIMKFFFQNSLADFGRYVPDFLYYFIPFLFVEKLEMANIINALLRALLKTQQKEQCSAFLSEFYKKLSSAVMVRSEQPMIYAMNQENGLDAYINILIISLVYGWQSDCEIALNMYLLILNSVKPEYIIPHTLKLMGPLIRVANYNYDISFKKKIIEVLGKMHLLKLPIKAFESQLQLTYFRLIKEANNEIDVLELLVFNFIDLMANSNRKDFLMNEVFERFKETVPDETGRNGYLYLISKVLNKHIEFFSKALLENLFQHILNIGLLEINSIETVYYMGKVLGLTSTFSKKSLVKDAVIRESNALFEENKEDLENNNNNGVEKYKALSNILGVFSNKRLEFDEELLKIAEKVSDDIYLALNTLKPEQVDLCMKFFKRIEKTNTKIKPVILKKGFPEKLRKEIKEKFKNFEF